MDIEQFIPHRGRMKLIEEVLEVDDVKAVTLCRVNENWPLFGDGSVDPIVLIELTAQTSGVLVGWQRKHIRMGGEGWLVGLKRADFFTGRIPAGTELKTRVVNLYSLDNYGVFEGTVESGSLLAKVEIQVFRS